MSFQADITSRFLTLDDAQPVIDLYRAIAAQPGGFARTAEEISIDYVKKALRLATAGGVGICAIDRVNGRLVGSIIARKLPIKVFDHVLSELTIGVHPEYQRQGIGRRLFLDFQEHVQMSRPDILRVELIARETNLQQIAFYESIGFRREDVFERRIRNTQGEFESDIPMAWLKSSE
jgi:ribosomal protein S18 acetylase RimI-like enzyme